MKQLEQHKKAVLESISQGASVAAACKAAGVGRTTFYRWLKEDAEFRSEVAHTEEAAIQAVEDAVWLSAVQGKTAAQVFFLCNRAPDRWRNVQRVDVDLSGEVGINVSKMADDELRNYVRRSAEETIKLAEELGGGEGGITAPEVA